MQNIRSRAGGCRAASLFVVSFLISCLTMGTSAAGAQSQAAHPKSAFDREVTSYGLTMPKVSAMTHQGEFENVFAEFKAMNADK